MVFVGHRSIVWLLIPRKHGKDGQVEIIGAQLVVSREHVFERCGDSGHIDVGVVLSQPSCCVEVGIILNELFRVAGLPHVLELLHAHLFFSGVNRCHEIGAVGSGDALADSSNLVSPVGAIERIDIQVFVDILLIGVVPHSFRNAELGEAFAEGVTIVRIPVAVLVAGVWVAVAVGFRPVPVAPIVVVVSPVAEFTLRHVLLNND